jgi:hypothetical protein
MAWAVDFSAERRVADKSIAVSRITLLRLTEKADAESVIGEVRLKFFVFWYCKAHIPC